MDELIKLYEEENFKLEQFMKRMVNFFQDNPEFKGTNGQLPIVHSVRYRMKDKDHLREKIERKRSNGGIITKENFFDMITDLAGIRVLHLYTKQVETINHVLMEEVRKKEIALFEKPKAYTWDIDTQKYFQGLGMETQVKPSYYTSVHYVVMPKDNSPIKCEIQVRTLFEEAWGEIDHSINYPVEVSSIACKEQLKVLAQVTAASSRLADSIIKSKKEYDRFNNIKVQ